MANTFISYSRENETVTESLVEDIKDLGHDVWFDDELSGGQEWWKKILESIRKCDIFIFLLSNDSLDSTACTLEYEYADALGKTIIPVLVSEGVSPNLLPPALSKIQFIDYRKRDREAVLHLAKAFTTAPPSSPFPDPLPSPPKVPLSYLGGFVKQINTTSTLSYEEQIILVAKLKRSLAEPDNSHDAQTLLKNLRKRPDLLANIADEIDDLLHNTTKHIQNTKQPTIDTKISTNKPFWKSQFTIYSVTVAVIIGLISIYGTKNNVDKNNTMSVLKDADISKSAQTIVNKNVLSDDEKNKEPKDANAWFNKGFGFFNLKRYKEAISAYNKAIRLNPKLDGAFYNKGLALANLDRYDEAITAYSKAIELNPNDADIFYSKGLALLNLKRYDEAIIINDKAIHINPNYADVLNNKGLALSNLKRYDEAITNYNKTIEINPNHTNAFYNKGLALYNLKRYDEAISAYDKAIAINPNNADSFYNKGLALANLNRYRESIAAYDKAIEVNPYYTNAFYNKGLALFKLKHYEKAVSAFDKAIVLNPNYTNAHYNKGLSLYHLKRYDDALTAYDKTITISPNDFEVYYNKAYIFALKNNKKMLLKNLEKAIQGNNKYKNMAKENKDFKKYWKDKDFKKLVENIKNGSENSEVIEPKQIKKYFYICYDKKNTINNTQEIFYKGCKIYNTSCKINKKEHFGKYLTNNDANAAYNRCISGTPLLNSSIDELMKQGKSYYHGTANKAIDYLEAEKYFLQASKQNSVDAYRYLGTMYLFGNGVSVDKKQAAKWLKKAIEKGDRKAKRIYTKYFKETQNSKHKILTLNENGIEISIYYPQNIQAGEEFILKATMHNRNSTARMGGLTLSFPHLNSILYKKIKNTFDSLKYYEAPTKLYSSIQKKIFTVSI